MYQNMYHQKITSDNADDAEMIEFYDTTMAQAVLHMEYFQEMQKRVDAYSLDGIEKSVTVLDDKIHYGNMVEGKREGFGKSIFHRSDKNHHLLQEIGVFQRDRLCGDGFKSLSYVNEDGIMMLCNYYAHYDNNEAEEIMLTYKCDKEEKEVYFLKGLDVPFITCRTMPEKFAIITTEKMTIHIHPDKLTIIRYNDVLYNFDENYKVKDTAKYDEDYCEPETGDEETEEIEN